MHVGMEKNLCTKWLTLVNNSYHSTKTTGLHSLHVATATYILLPP